MIAAGYVADSREAFDTWLATGRPAFVRRHPTWTLEILLTLILIKGILTDSGFRTFVGTAVGAVLGGQILPQLMGVMIYLTAF